MAFTEAQKISLLAEKGIGKTIITRFEQMGLDNIEKLAHADVTEVLHMGAELTQSSCWKNSPQAKHAITTAIAWANHQLELEYHD